MSSDHYLQEQSISLICVGVRITQSSYSTLLLFPIRFGVPVTPVDLSTVGLTTYRLWITGQYITSEGEVTVMWVWVCCGTMTGGLASVNLGGALRIYLYQRLRLCSAFLYTYCWLSVLCLYPASVEMLLFSMKQSDLQTPFCLPSCRHCVNFVQGQTCLSRWQIMH